MNRPDLPPLLKRCDEILATVPVSGDGVFAMAEARRTLKRAFDLASEPEHEYSAEA